MNTIKSRMALAASAVVIASSMTAFAVAAPDYERIKKDIDVMIGIVKSAFRNEEDCSHCSVQISGHYLADQGAIFKITPASHQNYNFNFQHGPGAPGIAGIPGFVGEILQDVEISLNDDEVYSWEFHTTGDEDWSDDNRETREALREARREIRELRRELRELEIEAIHSEDEEQKSLQARENELEDQIARAESRLEQTVEKANQQNEKRNQQRKSRRAKKEAEKQRQFEQIETAVLNTFCDYSRTMRNLPTGEKISIIVDKGDAEANIYVFDQSKLASCDSEKDNVRDKALSYIF